MGNKTDTVLYGAELIRLPGFICDFVFVFVFWSDLQRPNLVPCKRRRIAASRGLRRLTPSVSALKRKKEMGGWVGGGGRKALSPLPPPSTYLSKPTRTLKNVRTQRRVML